VASVAGVGKPAIYHRFRDKAELVATVIEGRLPQLELPDIGDTRAELWLGVESAQARARGRTRRGLTAKNQGCHLVRARGKPS
jgi:AcrR family transcriptional regulator